MLRFLTACAGRAGAASSAHLEGEGLLLDCAARGRGTVVSWLQRPSNPAFLQDLGPL